MKSKYPLIIFIILFGISAYLFYRAYDSVKKEMIRDLNIQQATYAKQAAKGIESFFQHHLSMLKSMAQNNDIIDLNEQGRNLIRIFYNNNSSEISGITRVNREGRIIYTYPYDKKSIGADISAQEHIREIMKSHQPVVSDVFETVQGFRSIAFHVPVFRGKTYAGSIAFLFPFDHITKNFLENIKIGKDGYAWLISRKGIELYCPVPGHVGKNVDETSGRFPSVMSMTGEMKKGKQGETLYTYDQIRGNATDTIIKHAVYMPIPVINTYWSIAVATPEDEVLAAMKSFRNNLILIIVVIVFVCIFAAYFLIKAWATVREQKKRKKAEEALKENEEFLRMITENVQDAIRVIDLNTLKYVYANPYAQSMFGRPDQGLLGSVVGFNLEKQEEQNVFELIKDEIEHDRERDLNRSRLIEIKEKGKLTGALLWTENKVSFIRDKNGKPTAILVISRDITERKLTEDELRKTGDRYRAIIENIEEGYFEVNLKGNMVFCNPSLCRILGYSSDELIGMNNLQYMNEENAKKVSVTFNRVYRTNVPEKSFDWELNTKDGGRIIVEASVSLITDAENTPLGFRGIVRDITLRRKAEIDRQLLEERLSRAEKMEAIGTLAGGVAHDMNNVLGVLVGYSELLREKIPPDSPLKQYVDNILQSGQRGAAIIQDLLTLARRGVAVSEIINLNNVISEYVKTPEFEILKTYHPHVQFRMELEKDLLNTRGSPVHLSKVVMNLVSNASEAISGTGAVVLRTENLYVESPLHGYERMKKGDYVVLKVSDNGRGIPARDVGKIFEPFYTKKIMGRSGTGLGLAIVWGTVHDHNGYIDVQSEEGRGSIFTIYFPASREEITKDEETIPPESYSGHGESILAVDDISEQRALAVSMLTRLGYQVETAASGEEAISWLREKKADLVLLDMIMDPGMDGLETYEKILEINPRQKTIIVSGFSETDRVKRAQELGAGAYVRKPYILKKIGLAIRKELDR
jgi:PAS domain S-box-containing protein